MSLPVDRRQFLATSALGGLGLLGSLPAVSADEARIDPKVVRLDPGIEPLVRLLEDTPRDRLLEEVGGRIKKGLSYQRSAGRPVPGRGAERRAAAERRVQVPRRPGRQLGPPGQPGRPGPGALAADLLGPGQLQVGPGGRNVKERGGWRLPPVKESSIPPARKARQALVDALEKWDPEAADVAVAGLVRTAGADEVTEVLWKYAPRDFRSIGHKIIFAANARRTLGVIGWQQHAEPILRSLVYAMLATENRDPKADAPADRPGRINRERAKESAPTGRTASRTPAAATELLAAFRAGVRRRRQQTGRGPAQQGRVAAVGVGRCVRPRPARC